MTTIKSINSCENQIENYIDGFTNIKTAGKKRIIIKKKNKANLRNICLKIEERIEENNDKKVESYYVNDVNKIIDINQLSNYNYNLIVLRQQGEIIQLKKELESSKIIYDELKNMMDSKNESIDGSSISSLSLESEKSLKSNKIERKDLYNNWREKVNNWY